MFVLGNLLNTVAMILQIVIWSYFWVIIARVVLSWVNPDPFNPIVRFIYRATEPVLRPIRHRLPTAGTGLDLSPMIVMIAIWAVDSFLISTIRDLAVRLRY
jgi:YggT family protein